MLKMYTVLTARKSATATTRNCARLSKLVTAILLGPVTTVRLEGRVGGGGLGLPAQSSNVSIVADNGAASCV